MRRWRFRRSVLMPLGDAGHTSDSGTHTAKMLALLVGSLPTEYRVERWVYVPGLLIWWNAGGKALYEQLTWSKAERILNKMTGDEVDLLREHFSKEKGV